MSRDNCPGGAGQHSSVAPESFICSPAEPTLTDGAGLGSHVGVPQELKGSLPCNTLL